MYISKEEAKRLIDEAPGKIWLDSFNGITYIHTKPKQITPDEGKRIINKADDEIDWLSNNVFNRISLSHTEMVHNIKFCSCEGILWDSQRDII